MGVHLGMGVTPPPPPRIIGTGCLGRTHTLRQKNQARNSTGIGNSTNHRNVAEKYSYKVGYHILSYTSTRLLFFEHAFTRAYNGDVPLLETVPLYFRGLFQNTMALQRHRTNTLQNTNCRQHC